MSLQLRLLLHAERLRDMSRRGLCQVGQGNVVHGRYLIDWTDGVLTLQIARRSILECKYEQCLIWFYLINALHTSRFPRPLPQGLLVPSWAYLNVEVRDHTYLA